MVIVSLRDSKGVSKRRSHEGGKCKELQSLLTLREENHTANTKLILTFKQVDNGDCRYSNNHAAKLAKQARIEPRSGFCLPIGQVLSTS